MFYKVMTPIGQIIVRSTCRNPKSLGLCHCYKYFEPYKKISMEQLMHYQKCKVKSSSPPIGSAAIRTNITIGVIDGP